MDPTRHAYQSKRIAVVRSIAVRRRFRSLFRTSFRSGSTKRLGSIQFLRPPYDNRATSYPPVILRTCPGRLRRIVCGCPSPPTNPRPATLPRRRQLPAGTVILSYSVNPSCSHTSFHPVKRLRLPDHAAARARFSPPVRIERPLLAVAAHHSRRSDSPVVLAVVFLPDDCSSSVETTLPSHLTSTTLRHCPSPAVPRLTTVVLSAVNTHRASVHLTLANEKEPESLLPPADFPQLLRNTT